MTKTVFLMICYVLSFSPSIAHVYAECIKGDCKEGLGVLILREGYKYDGQFKDGRFHGYGTLTHYNGGKYEGGWKKGQYHGQGTLILPGGCKYVGGWRDSLPFGKGAWLSLTAKEISDSEKMSSQHHGSGSSSSRNPTEIVISAPF